MPALDQGKSIAILQSNYIPWKGYFDIIASVDEFLIFDDAQYTRRDWRNRNKIILNDQLHWLTIPVKTKGNYKAKIMEIEIADRSWADKHWKTVKQAYRQAPGFQELAPQIEALYGSAAQLDLLTQVNQVFLKGLAELLGLEAELLRTDKIDHSATTPTDRLVEICVTRQATQYVSGPSAKSYIAKERFDAKGIELFYANYDGYEAYDQGAHDFEGGVSILDLLFRFGSDARKYLKCWNGRDTFLDRA